MKKKRATEEQKRMAELLARWEMPVSLSPIVQRDQPKKQGKMNRKMKAKAHRRQSKNRRRRITR